MTAQLPQEVPPPLVQPQAGMSADRTALEAEVQRIREHAGDDASEPLTLTAIHARDLARLATLAGHRVACVAVLLPEGDAVYAPAADLVAQFVRRGDLLLADPPHGLLIVAASGSVGARALLGRLERSLVGRAVPTATGAVRLAPRLGIAVWDGNPRRPVDLLALAASARQAADGR